MYKIFDNLMVLDRGKTVYFGDASNAVDYYSSIGYPVPLNLNPIVHFIDLSIKGDNELNTRLNLEFTNRRLPEI